MIFLKTLEVLEKHGIAPNPDADQHFMVDEKMLKKIVSSAKIKPEDVVLEIGAGIGNLTKLLAKKAKKVYAIEKDAKLSGALNGETSGFGNVDVIIADALKIDFPKFDKLVSNLPYQICEALVQRLIMTDFKSAVVSVPETFAKRLCAKEGEKEVSKLSIVSQAFFDAKILGKIKKSSFYPVPRTESVLLELSPKKHPGFRDYFFQEFCRQGDKKVKNALRESLIFASKRTGNKFVTKRAARDALDTQAISEELLEKQVAELNLGEIRGILNFRI